MPALMRSFDAVLLPSLTLPGWKEQFGRVLVEAMASGVPVVGSDSGEIPRVTGKGGVIVPEGDEDALAGALFRLYSDAGLRADLGKRGRERVLKHFTHARIAQGTLEAYSAALGG
jgi:glycosyltransferase involved in cell wall biosynthesis